MIALNPGNLCVHHVYTVDGKPDSFYIYTDNWFEDPATEIEIHHLYAEEIFMILASPTYVSCGTVSSSTVSSINILTSAGIIGTLMVHSIYDDRFAVIDGGY